MIHGRLRCDSNRPVVNGIDLLCPDVVIDLRPPRVVSLSCPRPRPTVAMYRGRALLIVACSGQLCVPAHRFSDRVHECGQIQFSAAVDTGAKPNDCDQARADDVPIPRASASGVPVRAVPGYKSGTNRITQHHPTSTSIYKRLYR